MKKLVTLSLALAMVLSLASCDSGASSDPENTNEPSVSESVEDTSEEASEEPSEEETEPTTEEADEDAPSDYEEITVENTHYGLKAELKVPPMADRTIKAANGRDDVTFKQSYYYSSDDAKAVKYEVTAYLYAISTYTIDNLEEGKAQYEKFKKTTIGDKEVYRASEISEYNELKYETYYFGDDYLDGKVMLKIEGKTKMEDNPLSQEDFEKILDDWVKYAKISGDDSAMKDQNGNIKYLGYDITVPENIKIDGTDVKVQAFMEQGMAQYKIEDIQKDDLKYTITTFNILPKASWESSQENADYSACTIGGRDALMYASLGNGAIKGEAIVKLDDENYLRIDIRSEGFLSGGDLEGGLSLFDKCKELMNDENAASTKEMLTGFANDFVSAMIIGGGEASSDSADTTEASSEAAAE